jgi:hypothetical protein
MVIRFVTRNSGIKRKSFSGYCRTFIFGTDYQFREAVARTVLGADSRI